MAAKPTEIWFWWDPNNRIWLSAVRFPFGRTHVIVPGMGMSPWGSIASALKVAAERGVIY